MKFLNKSFNLLKGDGPFYADIIAFHKFNTLYFAIPKVANSSLKAISVDILIDEIDDKYISDPSKPYTLRNGEAWKPFTFRDKESRDELRKKRILINYINSKEKKFWKFAIVRNPYDRLVSCYSQKVKYTDQKGNLVTDGGHIEGVARSVIKQYNNTINKNTDFSEFVNIISEIPDDESDRHFKSQYTFISNKSGKLLVDYVGKFENLSNEFSFIKKKCGFPSHIELPHLLKSNRKDYSSYYTDDLLKKVKKRYETDIAMFDYNSKGLC